MHSHESARDGVVIDDPSLARAESQYAGMHEDETGCKLGTGTNEHAISDTFPGVW